MLKEYSMYFSAFLLNNLKNKEEIRKIILFGSVARDESDKESDIDIFIEVKRKTQKIEKEIRDIGEKFYHSREASLFKLKNIRNEFNIKIGRLEEWKDLERSIASTGIILYGSYELQKLPLGVKHFLIVFWNKIGKNRGAFLNKIYGFNIKGKYYEGLLSKFSGRKLGKSCIMIPIQYKQEIFELLKKYEVEAKSIEVFS